MTRCDISIPSCKAPHTGLRSRLFLCSGTVTLQVPLHPGAVQRLHPHRADSPCSEVSFLRAVTGTRPRYEAVGAAPSVPWPGSCAGFARRGGKTGSGALGCGRAGRQHRSDASFLSAGWLRCSDHLLLAGTGKQQLKIEGDFWFTQMPRDNFGSPKAKETKLSGFNGSLSPSCSMFMGKQAADQTRQTAAGEAQ